MYCPLSLSPPSCSAIVCVYISANIDTLGEQLLARLAQLMRIYRALKSQVIIERWNSRLALGYWYNAVHDLKHDCENLSLSRSLLSRFSGQTILDILKH